MDKYIIYTMGIRGINEAIQNELIKRGIFRGGGRLKTPEYLDYYYITFRIEDGYYMLHKEHDTCGKNFKELTFRELMELPPVHNEEEELAERIVGFIENCTIPQRKTRLETQIGFKDGILSFKDWAKKQDWCVIWEKMKPKLGL